MKINSISSFNYNSNKINFKRTAVPYPEYEYAYNKQNNSDFGNIIDKIAGLFSPSTVKEADRIKSGIDNIYMQSETLKDKTPKAQLLSVLA